MAEVNFIRQSSGIILAHYRYGGGRLLRYSTRRKVDTEYWNKGHVKNTCPDYKDISLVLKAIKAHIMQVEGQYIAGNMDLTVEKFKNELNKRLNRTPAAKKVQKINPDLVAGFEQYYELKKAAKALSDGTLRGYKVVSKKLKEYAEYKHQKRIEFKDINGDFYDDILNWMRSKEYTNAYIGAFISKIKSYLNHVWENSPELMEGVTRPGWKVSKFKRLNEEADNVYLNTEQLARIEEKDLSDIPRLERVRDAFLIGCWTGLRFSDLSQITPDNFGQVINKEGKAVETLRVVSQKTKKTVNIPVHPCVKRIINHYKGKPPRIPTNQIFNRYIKDALKECELTEKISIVKPVKGKRVTVKSPLYKEVSSHTARRSFASNMYKSGVPAITIMSVTGHRSERSFLAYIKIDSTEHAAIMAASQLFTPKLKVAK